MKKNNPGKKIILNSIIYSTSGILIQCFSFFLLPLYTTYLTTDDYGITSIASSFISTFSFIVTFSLFSAVMRFYVDYSDNPRQLKRFYGTIVSFIFITNGIFFIICTIFNKILIKFVFNGLEYYPVIFITLIALAFSCQQTVYINILQSQQKAFKCSVLSIIYFFIMLTLNIIFIVKLKMGAVGSLLATMIGYIIYTIYFLFDMIRNKEIKFCIDIEILKDALRYSIPIMPHNLSTQIAVLISKVLIGGKVSISSVGIYSLASKFGEMADVIQNYVDRAYGPWLYRKLHDRDKTYKNDIYEISRILNDVLGLLFIGIALFAQDYIFLFLDKSYCSVWKFVPAVVLVYTIKIPYYFYVEVLFYYKEASRKLFISTITSSIFNVIFSYFWIQKYGIYGSILADAVSMLIRVGIIIYISKQYEDVGLKIRDFVFNFIAITSFICLGFIFSFVENINSFSFSNFLYKCFIVLLYICFVFIRNKSYIISILKNMNRDIKEKRSKD